MVRGSVSTGSSWHVDLGRLDFDDLVTDVQEPADQDVGPQAGAVLERAREPGLLA